MVGLFKLEAAQRSSATVLNLPRRGGARSAGQPNQPNQPNQPQWRRIG